jgi:predicted membrane-bound spermidine synthase
VRVRISIFPTLAVAFFLTGFSALLYQVVWQRLLGLFAGSDARSVTIVVSAYLAGLGIGSLLGSRIADRLSGREAVRCFGWANLGIAAFAFLSPVIYYDLLFLQLSARSTSPLFVGTVSFASLLLPTALMGISLPLLARSITRSAAEAPGRISVLYAINTLGSALGSLTSGWYLMGTLGYQRAVYLGGAISLVAALIALAIAGRFDAKETANESGGSAVPGRRRVPTVVWTSCVLVCLSGFIAISLELIWFRVTFVMVQATSYTFPHLLTFVLVGYAMGSWLGGALLGRVQNPQRTFLGLQAAVALVAVGTVFVIYTNYDRILPLLLGRCPAGLEPLILRRGCRMSIVSFVTVTLGLPALMLLPANILIGASFPIAQKMVQTQAGVIGKRVGLLQLANIVGNVAGGLLTGTLLWNAVGTSGALRVIAALGVIFVVLALRARTRDRGRGRAGLAWGGVLALGLAGLLVWFPSTKDFWSRLHHGAPKASVVAEDAGGVVVIQDDRDAAYIFANGGWQGTIPYETYHGFLGVVPALTHPKPRDVLVIGIGSGGTPFGVGVNPDTERITAIEIVGAELPALREFAQRERGALIRPLLADRRYRIVIGDGRHELATARRTFDIIEADPILPIRSYSGMLYSVEFFEQARAKLADGGIFAQWIPTRRSLAGMMQTFPHGVIIGRSLVLASNQPIAFDKSRLLERMKVPGVRDYLERGGLSTQSLRDLLEQAAVTIWTPATPRGAEVKANTDLWPQDEYFLNNP